ALEAEAHGARPGHLAEAREPDAGHGEPVAEGRRVGHASGRVSARSAVPTSFRSPSWFSVQISHSASRSAPSSRTALTRPRQVTPSPGQVSFAKRAGKRRIDPTPPACTRNSPRYPMDSMPWAKTPG